MNPSFPKLPRRTLLRGTGAALSLPFLESLGHASAPQNLPARMAFVYFPFGVALPKDGNPGEEWNWYPKGKGKDFAFRNVLQAMEPLREDVTILHGLSHPKCRRLGGHDTGDTFLTGHFLQPPAYSNSISIDQLAAQFIGTQTRFPSLTLSSDGGVGEPTRSTTLSFNASGRPVPALANPKQIFAKLFGQTTDDQLARQRINSTRSYLDLVLNNAKSLRPTLAQYDKAKFDEYLDSVRDIEKRVEQSRKWLEIPKPRVDETTLDLSANPDGPAEYIQVIYDLIYLAFRTDSTRLATYMLGQVAGATTIANSFPTVVGEKGNWHGLAHGAGKDPGALGKFDQFLANHLARFLTRLKETPEGDGNMLDRTMVLYGSSNSNTHNNNNYPLLLAGGRKLGLQHGQFLHLNASTPFANLFVTLFDRMKLPVESFADSTGPLEGLLV
jgi:hypothetical protein